MYQEKLTLKLFMKKLKPYIFGLKVEKEKKPNIGVLGLNPHNSELRKFRGKKNYNTSFKSIKKRKY